MADIPVDPALLRRISDISVKYSLEELTFAQGSTSVRMVSGGVKQRESAQSPLSMPRTNIKSQASAHMADNSKVTITISAPIMGVFYRSSSPGEPAYVDIGDVINVGDPIGSIEAMKVFSEVMSDAAGRVVTIPAQHGKLIQSGEPLVVLEAV